MRALSFAPLATVRPDALSLWERSVTRTPFTHPAYIEAVGDAFGLTPVAGLGDACGILGLEKTRGPLCALALHPASPEAPPLLVDRASGAETHGRQTPLDHLIRSLGDRYDQAAVALGAWPDARPFEWAGWDVKTRYTYHLRLDAAAPDRWSKTVRWLARRHRDDYSVEWDRTAAADAVRLELASYDRKEERLGLSPEALLQTVHALMDAGLGTAVVARKLDTGLVDAAAVFARDGDRVWYWIAGGHPGPAMSVLLDSAVRDLAADGATLLDWGGANVPSVAEFKRKRADDLVPVLTVRHVGPRWLRALQAVR